ncbi:MAG: hypothetical protein SPK65_02050 [Succinivibrio dextrinosolvens]|nr:hypothetical protein [Succinivibrio dextrinosolvens]
MEKSKKLRKNPQKKKRYIYRRLQKRLLIMKKGRGNGVSRITLQMVQELLKKCAQSMFCYVRDLGYHPYFSVGYQKASKSIVNST